MVTLLVAMVIALPLAMAVLRSLRRHHVPWVEMVAGIESMNPVQLS
jgi:hypothetical protein